MICLIDNEDLELPVEYPCLPSNLTRVIAAVCSRAARSMYRFALWDGLGSEFQRDSSPDPYSLLPSSRRQHPPCITYSINGEELAELLTVDKRWNVGMLECWNVGLLDWWAVGLLDC